MKTAELCTMSIVLTSVTFVLSFTVVATGLRLPECRMEGCAVISDNKT